jgi:alpha-L-arabinofuranosidase
MQRQTDPIGYHALSSYGSPAYYVQKMFSLNHGDSVVSITTQGVPTRKCQPPAGLGGVAAIAPKGQLVALTGSGPEDTNSITQPAKILPVTTSAEGLGADFTRTFPPYSVSVLLMKGK